MKPTTSLGIATIAMSGMTAACFIGRLVPSGIGLAVLALLSAAGWQCARVEERCAQRRRRAR